MTLDGYEYITNFWDYYFTAICDFLMAEPICYILALILLVYVAAFLRKLFHINSLD